ncbi:MAG: hypothetical protein A3E31_10545 [Candidatus Rokubacteria bacterium RIFCSPHIGHO2_12_FULL_73_22]|uniref:Uncharacterized protein n=1 Tax=uncultured bacterium Rifle_16ft_4_minimus_37862 TaxID=1665157 RepID=A0A0H4TQI1_9BACT|nr:hypothetical protein [uncultured bacterium Rifle_16ft_4_minimus_37862]OGL01904.1 MAG: hypothetical protein A3D33_02225 [Candidatus Rokubacteria bacterium RIFCSPHIGHO2_02_FULL_73_26]OGL02910.1 MAG: hypothetical protein A3E31_10545 [Candidatus Rokubacteria bacterium RIFCSPHIGHO2_12_FULL_73_22]OGL12597.1 MAG: hypothetical protein A3I14_02410 [Candidatus Rokubacteria bacterium RIFCSPLOWO2_02_FULL_73_56]
MPDMETTNVATAAPAVAIAERAHDAALGAVARALRAAVVPVAIALVTFAVFSPALWNGFVEWDDQVTLYENPNWRGLAAPQLRYFFTTLLMGHYIPVTWLTFGLDYELWGMNPSGYHLTSLLIYALSMAVLYVVALRLLAKATTLSGTPLRIAAVAATLFFGLHPLRAESVAWATERRDVLSGLFFLLTVLTYVRAADARGRRRALALVASLGFYLLALGSKASVMVLPAVLILLDIHPLGRLGGGWRGWLGPAARRVWLEKLPFAVLGVAGALVTYHAQAANLFITPLERYPLSARVGMSAFSLWFYVEKTLLPLRLTPLYELPATVSLLAPRFLVPTLVVSAGVVALVALARRWPAGLTVFAYYAVGLGPVIGIVHSGHQLTHDRYSFLPGLGLALLVGAAAGVVARAGAAGRLRPALFKAVVGAGIAWALGLAVLTAQQVQVWRDTETLWRYSLESDPDCSLCHGNLGVFLSQQGHLGLAITQFDRVLELRPDQVKAHKHLGYSYALLSEWDKAIAHYRVYLAKRSDDADVLNNLGAALISAHRPDEALVPLRRAAGLKPELAFAHTNIGLALVELGRPVEALASYRRAVEVKFDAPQPWFGLTKVYVELGDLRAARTTYGILGMFDPKMARLIAPTLVTDW